MLSFSRLKHFLRFVKHYWHCLRLMHSPWAAYGYLRSGKKPDIGFFQLSTCKFQGRKEDWVAINEVLIQDEYACLKQLLSDISTPHVLDLGANVGSFALRTFLIAARAHVASVEAASDTFEILEANQKLNPSFKWSLFKYGVWSHDGPLALMRRGISVGHRVIENGEGDIVQGITLRSLLDKLGWEKADLIKMDIEGGEEAVVPSGLEVLHKTRFLIIEVHTDRINAEPVMDALHSVYRHSWQLNARTSSKPLFVMTNDNIDLGKLGWKVR